MPMEQLPIDPSECYPNARRIVQACGSYEYQKIWVFARLCSFSIEKVINDFTQVAIAAGMSDSVKAEIQSEDFRRYVAAKLGMM